MTVRPALAAMHLLTAVLVAAVVTVAPAGDASAAAPGGVRIDEVNLDDHPTVELTVTVPPQFEDFRLPKDAFVISEDGESRGRPLLGNTPDAPEAAPPNVVLAVDVSGSMKYDIADARAAARQFVQSLPRGSQVAIVTFGDSADVALDFTSDVATMREAIDGITVDPSAQTALYDGVRRAANLLQTGSDAPAGIILLSDGGDTLAGDPDGARDAAVRALSRRGATLWAVGLTTDESDPDALAALAGDPARVLETSDAEELTGIYQGLASDLSRRYLLRYESASSGDTEIGVQVEYGNVTARGRTTVTLPDAPASATRGEAGTPVAEPRVFTVTPPPLGTTAAYVAGVASIAIGSLLLWLMLLTPRSPITRERLQVDQGVRTPPRLSGLAEWTTELADRSLRDRELGARLDRQLEAAGLNLRPGEVVVIVVSSMVVGYTLGALAGGVIAGVLLALVPPIATRIILSLRREKRQAAFADQLTDVLQIITGNLRAGYGLLQGIDAVGRDADEPAAAEFRRILIEHRLGRDLNEAMQNCAERMDNADFAWVVQAIGIHRDVGGDLARVLDNIITTVRSRGEVHRQVRALSAEGRLSAWVLAGLPFVVLVAIQAMSPDYLADLVARPIGVAMLAAAGVMLLIGILWIRRLVKIRY